MDEVTQFCIEEAIHTLARHADAPGPLENIDLTGASPGADDPALADALARARHFAATGQP